MLDLSFVLHSTVSNTTEQCSAMYFNKAVGLEPTCNSKIIAKSESRYAKNTGQECYLIQFEKDLPDNTNTFRGKEE